MSKKTEAEPTAEPTKKRGLNAELQAMAKIDRILEPFTPVQVARILAWVKDENTPPDSLPFDKPSAEAP